MADDAEIVFNKTTQKLIIQVVDEIACPPWGVAAAQRWHHHHRQGLRCPPKATSR